MILTPLDQHDPRLRQLCAEVSRPQLKSREQQKEIEALLDFVYGVSNKTVMGQKSDRTRPNTVGLSASQVGIMKQICVADMAIGSKGFTDVHVLINPRIVAHSKAVLQKPEGCVNFPSVWGITQRWRSVQVAAFDRSGNELTFKLVGWPAILLQHEIDHVQGHLFIDRLIDPEHAHLVRPEQYSRYRKMKAEDWQTFIDMREWVVEPRAV